MDKRFVFNSHIREYRTQNSRADKYRFSLPNRKTASVLHEKTGGLCMPPVFVIPDPGQTSSVHCLP